MKPENKTILDRLNLTRINQWELIDPIALEMLMDAARDQGRQSERSAFRRAEREEEEYERSQGPGRQPCGERDEAGLGATAALASTGPRPNSWYAGHAAFFEGRAREASPFPRDRPDLHRNYRDGWDVASGVPASPTPDTESGGPDPSALGE